MFKHPFTANVSGPTSCGKTHFVKDLLQNCSTKISPTPQRIIWLYKRWQPLYDDIERTVYPKVEFIQGIPLDLDQDTFINPKTRHLIILDDLMTMASKDSRVDELFTEGSHHRNISVIAINQNLYYNKDPTQRRKCHYLVLFNNPIDKQQIMTLARQIYPENSQYLMRHFQAATSKAYGYLAIDLKPTTHDYLRLRTDVLSTQTRANPIKVKTETVDHLETDYFKETTHSQQHRQQQESIEDMPSCDDCGLVFDDMHDVQRHVKNWCPENEKKRKHEDGEDDLPTKKLMTLVKSKDDDSSNDPLIQLAFENKTFEVIAFKVKYQNEDEWYAKRQKYIDNGYTEKEAEEKGNEKLKPKHMNLFIKEYGILIGNVIRLQNGNLHSRVMKIVRFYLDQKYDFERAVKMAILKFKNELEMHIDDIKYETDTENQEDTDNDENDQEQEEN